MATLNVDRDAILEVARAHGTTVAAEWSGVSKSFVCDLRKRVDGYDRGRGRPNLLEIAAQAPRPDCWCRRCLEHRASRRPRTLVEQVQEAADLARAHPAAQLDELVADRMGLTLGGAQGLLRLARRDGLIPATLRARRRP